MRNIHSFLTLYTVVMEINQGFYSRYQKKKILSVESQATQAQLW